MRKSNKEFVYQAAFKLFLSNSFETVTIKDIEQATGMTRGAVFYYVKSKAELFCQVIDIYFFKAQDIQDKLQAIGRESHTFIEFIHLYVAAIEARMNYIIDLLQKEKAEVSRAYMSLILQAQDYYPDFNSRMNEVFDKELLIWKAELSLAQKKGEIKKNLDVSWAARQFRYVFLGMCFSDALKNGISPVELEYQFISLYMMIKE